MHNINTAQKNNASRQINETQQLQNNNDESVNGSLITDSLDLDNSDDLNKIIQKYEAMLSNTNNQE